MRYRSWLVGCLSTAALLAPATATASQSVIEAASPAATPANRVGATPAATTIEFGVGLQLGDPAGASELARAVSDPAGSSYHRYLTPAQWERRFSPSEASVRAVSSWLRAEGVSVEAVTPDRMTVQASAPANVVERVFATSLGEYRRGKRVVRLSDSALKVPSNLSALIAGVSGVDETVNTPDHLTGETPQRAVKRPSKEEQPAGFRNATPCSSYYGALSDTVDPPYGESYPFPLPYAVCGYKPAQLQSAYGLDAQIAKGIDGSGRTVAIVDAYVSPTLFSDAHRYSVLNQSSQVLRSGQFSELVSSSFNNLKKCEFTGWYGEQTLDVEAVHATAPGAHILYVGAKNCAGGLYAAVQQVVDGHLADVISNSWGENGGDVLENAGTRRAFDNVLLMAVGTGIGVQFSSGDEGDEFANLGVTVADYPPSSPYATAVGGTSLQVGAGGERLGELGWSTAKSVLCTQPLASEEYPGCVPGKIGKWVPPAPGAYLYGSGGGTSYNYPEPWYQEGVVPAALANRNRSVTGIANRVEPDISMDADPTTGMLVGETQEFPDGTYYDQYRIGGTSLASPLFAGVMADAGQAAGTALGFANPLLYRIGAAGGAGSGALFDVVPAGKQANVRVDYLDGVDASEGTITSVRVLDFEGREAFCPPKGECTHQKVALSTAPGFDSMTGLGSPGPSLVQALAAP